MNGHLIQAKTFRTISRLLRALVTLSISRIVQSREDRLMVYQASCTQDNDMSKARHERTRNANEVPMARLRACPEICEPAKLYTNSDGVVPLRLL